MQNDVNNETGASTTGEAAVEDTNKQEQPAEAQAPVTPPDQAPATPAASEASADTSSASAPAPAERTEPRRVAKPPAPPAPATPAVVRGKAAPASLEAAAERLSRYGSSSAGLPHRQSCVASTA